MAFKRRHIPDAHGEHPNVVPLIDVMLCIIVFYMLAAKIGVSSGADETIQIPVTALGKELTEVGGNTLILNVRERVGQPFVTAMVEQGSDVQEIAVEDKRAGTRPLRDTLRALLIGKDGKPNTADDNPTLKVVIRGDRDMTYRTFMPVMLSVTDAGVTNILHNTAKPKGDEP
jgi:biopolymer transport protein ExbD